MKFVAWLWKFFVSLPMIKNNHKVMTNKKALLVILDGWGLGDKTRRDVIYSTPTPHWDELIE
jgi:hypothetical protein